MNTNEEQQQQQKDQNKSTTNIYNDAVTHIVNSIVDKPDFQNNLSVLNLYEKAKTIGISFQSFKDAFRKFLPLDPNYIQLYSNQEEFPKEYVSKFFEILFQSLKSDQQQQQQQESTSNNNQNNNNDSNNNNSNNFNDSIINDQQLLLSSSSSSLVTETLNDYFGTNDNDTSSSNMDTIHNQLLQQLQNSNNNQYQRNSKQIFQQNLLNNKMLQTTLSQSKMNKLIQQPPTPSQSVLKNIKTDKSNLRTVILDGNDVAYHTNKNVFNFRNIKIVTNYFEERNHQVHVIISSLRKQQIMGGQFQVASIATPTTSSPSRDKSDLLELESKGFMFYSPSRRVGNRNIVTDDKQFTLSLAKSKNGIIVSNDDFKKFYNTEFKEIIEEKVLMYSLCGDLFMPAEEPLGKNGPNLSNFLRFVDTVQVINNMGDQYLKPCPYKKKCTFGNKCKYLHPERSQPPGLKQSYQIDNNNQKPKLFDYPLHSFEHSKLQQGHFSSNNTFQNSFLRDNNNLHSQTEILMQTMGLNNTEPNQQQQSQFPQSTSSNPFNSEWILNNNNNYTQYSNEKHSNNFTDQQQMNTFDLSFGLSPLSSPPLLQQQQQQLQKPSSFDFEGLKREITEIMGKDEEYIASFIERNKDIITDREQILYIAQTISNEIEI